MENPYLRERRATRVRKLIEIRLIHSFHQTAMFYLNLCILSFSAFPLVKCQEHNFQSSNQDRTECDAHNFKKQFPPIMIEQSETPAGARPHQAPTTPWTDFRIIYYIVPSTTSRKGAMLREAFDEVNRKLRPILKVQSQIYQMRMTHRKKQSADCVFPYANQLLRFGAEHHKPCYLNNGTFIPEPGISLNNSQENQLLESQHLGVIIYISADGSGSHCRPSILGAATVMAYDALTNAAPLIGILNLCEDPTILKAKGRLYQTILHETIHILTHGSFSANKEYVVGRNPQDIGDYDLNRANAENITWRRIPYSFDLDRGPEVVMTPAVLQATREYFKCNSPNLYGAELARLVIKPGDTEVIIGNDDGHWNDRLFPDEIMGSAYKEDGVLSKLTLAVLKETGWYQVDMSKADPMMFDATERNIEGDGCDIALSHCSAIWTSALQKLSAEPYKLPWVGSYCHPWATVPTRACTADGRFRLQCNCGNLKGKLTFCCVYMKNSSMDGDPIDCLKNYSQALPRGLYKQKQTGVTCVTFQNFQHAFPNNSRITKENYPMCMGVDCDRQAGVEGRYAREYITNDMQIYYGVGRFGQKNMPTCMTERGLCPKITAQLPCLPDDLIGDVGALPPPYVKRTTYANRPCRDWRSPQRPRGYWDLPENICRNPDGGNPLGPWCYTVDSQKFKETCFSLCSHHPVVRVWTWCDIFQGSKFVCPDYVQTCEGPGPLGPLTVRLPTKIIAEITITSGQDGSKLLDCCLQLLLVLYYTLQQNRKTAVA